jgi:hypothetical protein
MNIPIQARTRHRLLAFLGCLVLALPGPIACGPTSEPPEDAPATSRRSGLSLSLKLGEKSDVDGMRFMIKRVSCQGEPFSPYTLILDRELEDILLPGGIPEFQGAPFDRDSAHLFADLFIDLPEGCYDVTTQPLTADGTHSKDCLPATTPRVHILDGQTTEVLLINQCRGEGRGAIDVISALNHPPELVGLTFQKSKFVHQCADQIICATVADPDGDPVEIVWARRGGPALFHGPQVLSTTSNDDGSITQCIRLVAEDPGRYDLKVTVYDLLHHPVGGRRVRIEDFLREGGNPLPSNDSLAFFFYAASDGRVGGCTAPATSCKELKQREPHLSSGLYVLDPDGKEGPLPAYEAWCDMTTHGGGWTLVLVSSDDDQDTWTWKSRALLTTNKTPVGSVSERNKDFKSPALHQVAFEDLLFVHAPSSRWAAYAGVGDGSIDVGSFMAGLTAPLCDPSLGGNGYKMTAGSLVKGGWLCDTDLYFHLGDFDGTHDVLYCRGNDGFQDTTYGPTWNISFNHPCPFDDPGYASLGPILSYPDYEAPGVGFGEALGLNTGEPGTGQNHLRMYVR